MRKTVTDSRKQLKNYGGSNEKRQISEVTSCGLTRIGTLEFDLWYGACANMNDEKVFLCFDLQNDEGKLCRASRDSLGSFTKLGESRFDHYKTRIAATNG